MATRKKSSAKRKRAAIKVKARKATSAFLAREATMLAKRAKRLAKPTTGDARDAAAVRRIRRTTGRTK